MTTTGYFLYFSVISCNGMGKIKKKGSLNIARKSATPKPRQTKRGAVGDPPPELQASGSAQPPASDEDQLLYPWLWSPLEKFMKNMSTKKLANVQQQFTTALLEMFEDDD